ncbi:hypothetical protein ACFSVK_03850 [Azorhizophilus paspali]|uniref:hypothetical protein n=1 Tax=Azorhizophilus paspali TaxID=69963 RepID=UPI003628F905
MVKGRWKVGDFLEVGQKILDSLELASPFQWELAHRDLLVEKPWYNRKQIQLTIIAGLEDYDGIRGLVNSPGTDGTVVIAGTCLDSAKIHLDFRKPENDNGDYEPFRWSRYRPPVDFAFTVLSGYNHGSIISEIHEKNENQVSGLIRRALRQEDEHSFGEFIKELDTLRLANYKNSENPKPVFQQFIVRAVDDFGAAVTDFSLEFSLLKFERIIDHLVINDEKTFSENEERLSARLQSIIAAGFYTNRQDPSFRRFLVNLADLNALLDEAKELLGQDIAITVRIYIPDVEKGIRYEIGRLQNVLLYTSNKDRHDNDRPSFIFSNTTTLIEMKVDRYNHYVVIH